MCGCCKGSPSCAAIVNLRLVVPEAAITMSHSLLWYFMLDNVAGQKVQEHSFPAPSSLPSLPCRRGLRGGREASTRARGCQRAAAVGFTLPAAAAVTDGRSGTGKRCSSGGFRRGGAQGCRSCTACPRKAASHASGTAHQGGAPSAGKVRSWGSLAVLRRQLLVLAARLNVCYGGQLGSGSLLHSTATGVCGKRP